MKTQPSSAILIDLTAAPYHCDPSGQTDCTAALCRALDDAMEADRQAQLATIVRLKQPGAPAEGPETSRDRIIFPRNSPPASVLYLPAGTYRVSGTIGYSWSDHVFEQSGDHLARGIHWLGDGPDKTVLRLDDRCPAFQSPHGRPVVEFLRGLKSAVCMQNTFEGIAIHTGKGNPGAVGLDFFCNNTGAVRDVRVVSGDGQGIAGIAIRKWNSSCALFQRVRVEGFQSGVQILHHRLYSVMEDVEVSGQSVSGVWVDSHNVSIHRLRSRNKVPALTVAGAPAVVCALDLEASGGAKNAPAVDVRGGHVFLRDLSVSGYGTAIEHRDGAPVAGPAVAEWVSHVPWKLFSNQDHGSLRLTVEDPPALRPETAAAPARCISEFGAAGDGTTDDTAAIERAFADGAPRICFPRGRFLITRPLRIPAHVEHLDFSFADLEAGPELKDMEDRGAFLVGAGDRPLRIERLFTMTGFLGRHRLIEQDGVRTLVLRDLHTQFNAQYRNTVPGSKVYIENCACTCEQAWHLPGYHFTGQQVWARQLNPERGHVQVINDGGSLWVLGFKTEVPCTAFLTRNGGQTEILGGIFNQIRIYNEPREARPAVINDESSVSVTASTTDWRINRSYEGPPHVVVREIRGGVKRDLVWEVLPLRMPHLIALPLYTGRPAV